MPGLPTTKTSAQLARRGRIGLDYGLGCSGQFQRLKKLDAEVLEAIVFVDGEASLIPKGQDSASGQILAQKVPEPNQVSLPARPRGVWTPV